MKKYIIILLVSLILPCATFAGDKHDKFDKEHKVKKEEIFQAKVKTMAEKLHLTPEQVTKFVPIYREYIDDAMSMRPKHMGELSALTRHGKIKPGKELTQAEAYQIAAERLAIQQHILAAQQRALKKLQKVLTSQQLLDFPHVESQMGRRAAEALKDKNHPGHPKHPTHGNTPASHEEKRK